MNKSQSLLTRDEFRSQVFARDKGKCVVCGSNAKDAHHILERRLFPDGGYYLENGASLCEEHHIAAEQTYITCEQLRELIGIKIPIIPPHMYRQDVYDKWGNIILPNGHRLRGELFDDVSVQKILPDEIKALFVKWVKYPRTMHLPWSEGVLKDDKVIPSVDHFKGKQVVVTLKMDGENTTFYNDYMHARSVSFKSDQTRHWVQKMHAETAFNLPDGWRICGENLFAKHSILYNDLSSYFYMFSAWDNNNVCLSWPDTEEWASLLGYRLVEVLYRGIFDEDVIKKLYKPKLNSNEMEGYVVRLESSFHYREFKNSVAKFVRKDHIQTNEFWKKGPIVKNVLTSE